MRITNDNNDNKIVKKNSEHSEVEINVPSWITLDLSSLQMMIFLVYEVRFALTADDDMPRDVRFALTADDDIPRDVRFVLTADDDIPRA